MFNARKTRDKLIKWTKDWFDENGPESKAIIGISGGKDSSVCAAILVEALGTDRVIGVQLPNGSQHDFDYSKELIEYLRIDHILFNINRISSEYDDMFKITGLDPTNYVYKSNTPARIRMTVLYGIAAIKNGRVCNTCNLSEDWVGYATKFGDAAGDFSLLSHLTVTEVKELGRALDLPEKFIEKIPEDGLSGKTDEDNLGFTYAILDKYIREGICEDIGIKTKIDKMREAGMHKLNPMPSFKNE